ncbi:hypothetical protein [Halorussus litoreus]|uniref:hypothetical protein n=1 Tax=Halorussus litoreus TaxID=1710536 RepID=UPI0013003DE5|nr:hypothetical protein [Halorussus litoreus]
MRRRDTLRTCMALGATGGLGLLAGCSGGSDAGPETQTGQSDEPLAVSDFNYEEGDSGNLVVTATVTNAGESEATGYVYVTVTAAEPTRTTESEDSADADATTDGGDDADATTGEATTTDDGDDTVASRRSIEVAVPGGETKTFEIPFEFTVDQFERQGSLEIDLRN